MKRHRLVIALSTAWLFWPASRLDAQPLGSFTWQLQPFCNRVTLQVTQAGSLYTAEGYDDQCGAPQRAPLVGTITPNPDGSIGIGLHIVTVPGGRGLQVDARISLASLAGPWSDSAGHAGTFAFNGAAAGSPRPAVTIPGSMIALGAITAAHINGAQVQQRVAGVCADGQALRGVNQDGTVACTNALSPADDPANAVGWHSSMAIGTDGLPVIAHVDTTTYQIRVTHCGNGACSAGNVSTNVDVGSNYLEGSTSIRIGSDGLPIIAHHESSTVGLRVTHCGSVTCEIGNVSTTVDDQASGVGLNASLVIGADGLPIISHRQSVINALRVTHCGNVTCTAGNVSTTVDDGASNAGWFSSIAVGVDGMPVISHQDLATGTLRVTHCGNVACTAGNVSTIVDDPADDVGFDSSLVVGLDGLPVIAHRNGTAGVVRVTHCGNAACSAGNTSTNTVAAGAYRPSMVTASDGRPLIAHFDITQGDLLVTHCGNAACTSGNATRVVDAPPNANVGEYPSLVIGRDGLPVISYRDVTASTLRVAKCGTPTCQ